MNSRYYLTFKSTFQSEKPKKLEKTSFNVKFFDWDYLHLTALMKESYFNHILIFITDRGEIMPAMDLALIQSLGRDLHSHSPGYMGEDEVCPWTLFLTMALTLLKGWSII